MPTSDLQKRLEQDEAERKRLLKKIKDGKASLVELADADRALHALIDHYRGKNDKLVSAFKRDVAQVKDRLDHLHELQSERRTEAQKKADRIKREKRRLAQHDTKALKTGDQGPDVSVYQGSVNWDQVAASHPFGFTKASEGATYTDPTFSAGRLDSMLANLQTGAYHFARPDLNSPNTEAGHFASVVKNAGGKFISLDAWLRGEDGVLGALDFEHVPYSEPWAAAWGQAFAHTTGVKAVVYGGGYSLQPIHAALGDFAGVWIAGYPNWSGFSTPPNPFLHQFTSAGSVAGVPGSCDVSKLL